MNLQLRGAVFARRGVITGAGAAHIRQNCGPGLPIPLRRGGQEQPAAAKVELKQELPIWLRR